MIARYTRPEMGRIWSEENSFQKWLDVEILAAKGLAQLGKVPKAAIARIKKKAHFNIERIRKIEREVKHEIIAFLTSVAESIGDDARFLHLGMTSSDVMDTALAIQLKEASAILVQDVRDLMKVLRRQAFKYKSTVMIGRTHGVHAEPITFGLKLALWGRDDLAHDTGLPKASGAPAVSIAHNVAGREEVDAVMAEARKAGATIVKAPHETFYGGYAGYFRDPDGHLWEIAWNPAMIPS